MAGGLLFGRERGQTLGLLADPASFVRSTSREQHEPLPHGFLAWIPAILKMDARDIIQKNGLDAYVFVRFLWLMIEIFLPL
jgi:hypothetical protein